MWRLLARMARLVPIAPILSGLTEGIHQLTALGVLDGAWGAAGGAWVEAGVVGGAAEVACGREVARQDNISTERR